MRADRLIGLTLVLTLMAGGVRALTLEECLSLARQGNPTLLALRHQALQVRSDQAEVAGERWPRVDFGGGYSWQQEPQAFVLGGQAQPTQQRDYPFFNLSVEQTVYDFGRTSGRLQSAAARVAGTDAQLRDLEQELLLQTVVAYYRLLAAGRQLDAARQEVVQLQEHRRVAEVLLQQGVVTRNDLLQAEVKLAGSRQLQLARENAMENAWLQLNFSLGRQPEERGSLPEAEKVVPLAAPVAADLPQRPDLEAARQQLAAATAEVGSARSRFWPRLYARGEATYVENEHVRQQTIYVASVGVRGNLFDGFADSAALARAEALVSESRQRVAERSARATLEFTSAENDSRVAAARMETLATAIRQGEENLRLNRQRYREQVGTATEVIDAQTLLTQVRADYDQAIFDYQVAQARLRRAAGQL